MSGDEQDKRALVLTAAARLFSEHGYAATSIRDIARAVGVSPSTPYYVVGNKQEILVALYSSIIDSFLAALGEVIASALPPAEKLRRYLALSMQNIENNRERMKVVGSERRWLTGRALEQYAAKEQERRQGLLAILDEGVRAGIWRADLVPITSAVLWGTLSWYVSWYDPTSMGTVDQVIASLLELVNEGLAVRGVRASEAAGAAFGADGAAGSERVA